MFFSSATTANVDWIGSDLLRRDCTQSVHDSAGTCMHRCRSCCLHPRKSSVQQVKKKLFACFTTSLLCRNLLWIRAVQIQIIGLLPAWVLMTGTGHRQNRCITASTMETLQHKLQNTGSIDPPGIIAWVAAGDCLQHDVG